MERRALYTIANWDRDFENANSRITANCTFVCVGNHFDGKKIRRLARHEQGQQLHGAFLEIVQVASKCPWRGVLMDGDGPIGALDLADKTLFSETGFELALEELSKPFIGLLERHEIECVDGTWVLPESVRRWAVHKSKRRLSVAERGNAWEPATEEAAPRHQPPPRKQSAAPAATDRHEPPPDATQRHEPHRTEQNRREESPLPSPRGGQGSPDLIEFDEAKSSLSDLFGREKRKWSREEDGLLAELCPIRRDDMESMQQWFRLPIDHQVFEQTKRKHNLTTLLRDFNGELDKARQFKPVFAALNGAAGGAQKKEPEGWREYFRAEYGPACILPLTFWQLPSDQREEWDRHLASLEEPAEAAQR